MIKTIELENGKTKQLNSIFGEKYIALSDLSDKDLLCIHGKRQDVVCLYEKLSNYLVSEGYLDKEEMLFILKTITEEIQGNEFMREDRHMLDKMLNKLK